MKSKTLSFLLTTLFIVSFSLLKPDLAYSHCDTLDGPVIKSAKIALETQNVSSVLIWIPKKDEAEIKKLFQKTLDVRKLTPESKELADMYFFETLVRIHRAGEGFPYTGLKQAGNDSEPTVPLSDEAIDKGNTEKLKKILTDKINSSIDKQFEVVLAKKNFDKNNIDAGREFVESYVEFLHYIEHIYKAVESSSKHHYEEIKEK